MIKTLNIEQREFINNLYKSISDRNLNEDINDFIFNKCLESEVLVFNTSDETKMMRYKKLVKTYIDIIE